GEYFRLIRIRDPQKQLGNTPSKPAATCLTLCILLLGHGLPAVATFLRRSAAKTNSPPTFSARMTPCVMHLCLLLLWKNRKKALAARPKGGVSMERLERKWPPSSAIPRDGGIY